MQNGGLVEVRQANQIVDSSGHAVALKNPSNFQSQVSDLTSLIDSITKE